MGAYLAEKPFKSCAAGDHANCVGTEYPWESSFGLNYPCECHPIETRTLPEGVSS